MALDEFIRDKFYFRLLRDNKNNINADDIDYEYGKIIDYINNDVVASINNIVDSALGGILGNAGFYLRNVGDGSTEWAELNVMINDYSLQFSKLQHKSVGSLLVSNGYGEIISTSANSNHLLLISTANSEPTWQLLKTENIENQAITGVDLGNNVIGREHLKGNININVPNNSLVGNNFTNNSITTDKIKRYSQNGRIIGIISPQDTSKNIFPQDFFHRGDYFAGEAGAVKNDHILPRVPLEKFAAYSIIPEMFNKVKCVIKRKIARQTINERCLLPIQNIATGTYSQYYLIPAVKIGKMQLNAKKLDHQSTPKLVANDFTEEVRAAFARKGCI